MILKLQPACKSYIWGGRRLKDAYNKQFDGEPLAETWELSCHPDGPSRIVGGAYDGKTLPEYLEIAGRRVLGSNCQIFGDFPILTKFIDAKDNLSVQVHPSNTYALEHENQYGKTEMWYVLEAQPGAFLYYGFQHTITQEEYRRRIAENTLTEVLNAVEVKKGDLFFIPAGTVHAIGKGMVIAEIQQNSNVTYRVYDYDRRGADGKPRQLHIEQAIQVSQLCPPRTDYNFGGHLARCAYFTVDRVDAPAELDVDEESFTSLLVLEGEGTVQNGDESCPARKGDSLFLPADSGHVTLQGDLQLLVTRIGTI